MRTTAVALSLTLIAFAAPAWAQDEASLKAYFEGHSVTVRIDMPGTQEGVDLHMARPAGIDLDDYRGRLKQYGTAIHAGEAVVVTLVKVKKDLIEFQLGGGGFGTFGDDTSTTVDIPYVEKSEREKDLEKQIRKEDDDHERRRLERELDDLRDHREAENRRIDRERERRSAAKADQVAENRLHGGSRFNLRWEHAVPRDVTPDQVMAALGEYVDFGSVDVALPPPPMQPGDLSALRKGMAREDVEQMFGRPAETSERREGGMTITTLVFVAGEQRIAADFVEGVLVRYTISSK